MSIQTLPELIMSPTDKPVCDGGGGPLGHPKVYLTMTGNGSVDCTYCGRRFVLSKGSSQGVPH